MNALQPSYFVPYAIYLSNFLVYPIDANPRRSSSWQDEERLASLPIYYLSFFKAPEKVLKAKRSVQRSFVWAGLGGNQKVARANWELVCQPKANGGLEVNEIRTIHSFHVLSHTKYGAMCISRWLEISITLAQLWFTTLCSVLC